MTTATLDSLVQRIAATEQEIVRLKQNRKSQSLLTGIQNSRERFLVELEKINPISSKD